MDNDTAQRIAIPCSCTGCRQPAAYATVRDGMLTLLIVTRHRGKYHETLLTLGDVAAMVSPTDDAAPSLPTP